MLIILASTPRLSLSLSVSLFSHSLFTSVSIFAYLFACLSVNLLSCLFTCMSACFSVLCLAYSVFVTYVFLTLFFSLYLPLRCLSLYVPLNTHNLDDCLILSHYFSVCVFAYLARTLLICLDLSACLSVCLSVGRSLSLPSPPPSPSLSLSLLKTLKAVPYRRIGSL